MNEKQLMHYILIFIILFLFSKLSYPWLGSNIFVPEIQGKYMIFIKFLIGIYFISLLPQVIREINEKETDKINRGQTGGGDNEP